MSAKNVLEGDPLSLSEMDPLTRLSVTEASSFSGGLIRSSRDSFEPWAVKKMGILSKFTTQEKLSITTSVYASSSGSGSAGKTLPEKNLI